MGNMGNTFGTRVGNNLKHSSVAFNGRMSDFDNPLMSNTVDLTIKQSQKDNQNLYKMMYQNSAGGNRQSKNLASNYLRGIDSQLRNNG